MAADPAAARTTARNRTRAELFSLALAKHDAGLQRASEQYARKNISRVETGILEHARNPDTKFNPRQALAPQFQIFASKALTQAVNDVIKYRSFDAYH